MREKVRLTKTMGKKLLDDSDIELLRSQTIADPWFALAHILKVSSWLYRPFHEPIVEFFADNSVPVLDFCGFRGCLKTTILSGLMVWHSLRDPNISIMLGSKIDRNAAATVRLAKSYWEKGDLLRTLFPELVPQTTKTQWSDTAATINRPTDRRDPTYKAVGLGSTVTSLHPNILILDDAVSAERDDLTGEEAIPTKEDIEKAIGFWRLSNTLVTSSNKTKGQKINNGTRWAISDLSYWIRHNENNFRCMDVPIVSPDGTPTWPTHGDGSEGFGIDRIEDLRASMGPYMFSGQYMLDPLPLEKMVFRPEWLQSFQELPKDMPLNIFVCTDPAISKSQKADFTGIVVVGVDPEDRRWVIDARQLRVDPTESANTICDLVAYYRTQPYAAHVAAVVETVAFQEALKYRIQDIVKDRSMDPFPLHKYSPRTSKTVRILGLVPYASNKKLLIASHLKDLRIQFLQYPRGRHEHLIDALSQHLKFAFKPQIHSATNPHPSTLNPFSLDRIRWENRKEAQRVLREKWMDSQTVWKGELACV